MTVDIYVSVAHSSVEDEPARAARAEVRCIELKAIPAGAYERKATGTACVFHSLFLTVLGNGHVLFIVIDAERAVNRPIVRHSNRLPL